MDIKQSIKKNDFKFKKSFGQNFITDDGLLEDIVKKAGVCEADTVIEIGVGAATLTRALSKRAKKVIAFEIDKKLAPIIADSLRDTANVEIVFKDFLAIKLSELEEKLDCNYLVVANLPYYITTPIIMKLIEESSMCKRIVVMVQKEVGLRLCANENTPDFGSISVSIDAVSDANIILEVSRDKFFPKPNVDSVVVRIDINRCKYEFDSAALYKTLKIAFNARRKTLENNLVNCLKISREQAQQILSAQGIPKSARGETLSTAGFISLSNALKRNSLIDN